MTSTVALQKILIQQVTGLDTINSRSARVNLPLFIGVVSFRSSRSSPTVACLHLFLAHCGFFEWGGWALQLFLSSSEVLVAKEAGESLTW